MPYLGAHMSTAGGLSSSFNRLKDVNGAAMQIFTKNQRQWQAKVLEQNEVADFIEAWKLSGSIPMASHDSYLINLAAPKGDIQQKSINAFSEELMRASKLKIPFLVTHPGAHLGDGIKIGLDRFITNLDVAIHKSAVTDVMILIETTAGQGSSLGSCFAEIATILEYSKNQKQLGVCLDTCHIFAAGYDIRNGELYEQTMTNFDKIIGFKHLHFFHLNDSKKDLGSHVDRHEHIGQGKLGLETFRLLLNDIRFNNHPMVLETPKEDDPKMDLANLQTLKSLLK